MHRIHRAEIHLAVEGPELAAALLDRCSELQARAIAPLIDRVCSELSGPTRIDRIDRLELDLGSLAVVDFDGEFLQKLEAGLRAGLQRALQGRAPVDARRSAIELLETFATLGNLPWWASTAGDPVAAAITTLIDDDPQPLIELLRALAGDAAGLTRLALHTDERMSTRLCERRWPATGVALAVAVRALGRALVDAVTPRRLLLAAIAGPGRDAPDVLRSLLLDLAVAHDWRPATLQARLADVARAPDLPALLRDACAAIGAPAHPDPTDAPTNSPAYAPGPSTRAHVDAAASPDPSAAPASHRPTPATPPQTGSVATAPGEPTDVADVAPASPRPTPATPPQTGPAATTAGEPTTDPPRPGEPRPATSVATTRAASTGASPRSLAPARPDSSPRAARDRALARLDGFHVEDGGLVLLWPFLDRLCLRCGLIDETRRFLDEPAQQRAVALFEMIVTGELAPPEFRLPLAKLLAGLPPDAALLLATPLDPAWQDECERLLAAVIGHARVLGELAPAAFRAGFLRRAAALGVHDGAWTLRVERATQDVALGRFPWGWAWVKLPWMPEALRVEW